MARRVAVMGIALLVVLALCARDTDRSAATPVVPAEVERHFAAAGRPGLSEIEQARVARHVYPMSVIPGGAFSVEELREYVASDPVAQVSFRKQAERLGDPDLLEHLEVRRLTKPVRMYTQLRRGADLLWSSEPVTVGKDEAAFYHRQSDELVARARCGNVMVVVLSQQARTIPPPQPPPPPPTPTPPRRYEVLPEQGAAQQQQQQTPPIVIPPAPPVVNNTYPPIMPPPIVPPAPIAGQVVIPPYIPPYIPPPQGNVEVKVDSGGPWWPALLGGLALLRSGNKVRVSQAVTNINRNRNWQQQNQWQKQKQQQKQVDKTPNASPEPGTILLMGVGLGAAGLLARRRRRS